MVLLRAAILFGFFGVLNGHISTPYQATIRLYNNFNVNSGETFDICTGTIIHESYILTSAHCVHSHVISANISLPYYPGMIYIVTGDILGKDALVRHITDIRIHEGFNKTTLENDIALLRVEYPLPLRNNRNISWVELPYQNRKDDKCYLSFRNESLTHPYNEPQPTHIMGSGCCNKVINASSQICSHYTFLDVNMCNKTANDLLLSNDRGTPLVCNNQLTGILSNILPANAEARCPMMNCTKTQVTAAVYTRVSPYIEWIYSQMGIAPEHIPHYNPQSLFGAPYKNSVGNTKVLNFECLMIGILLILMTFGFVV